MYFYKEEIQEKKKTRVTGTALNKKAVLERKRNMNGILFDNWNLEEVSYVEHVDEQEQQDMCFPNEAFSDLMNAYVLWDDIYYLKDQKYSQYWETYPILQDWKKEIQPLEIDEGKRQLFEECATNIYQTQYQQEKEVIAKGTLMYMLLSNYFKIPYLPMKYRCDFLQKVGMLKIYKDIQTQNKYLTHNREYVINKVDAYLDELFRELLDIELDERSFHYPVVTELILKNSNSPEGYINAAKDIRKSKELRNFRKDMTEIENAVQKGKWGLMLDYITDVREVVNEFGRRNRQICSVQGNVIIGILPSIDIGIQKQFFASNKKKFDLTFIRKAVNERLY